MKKYKIVFGQKFIKENETKMRWIHLGTLFYDDQSIDDCTIIIDALPVGHTYQSLFLKLQPIVKHEAYSDDNYNEKQPVSNENNWKGFKN